MARASLKSLDKILTSVLVDIDTKCWNWTKHITKSGYGRMAAHETTNGECSAHRYSYSILRGKIPDGMTIDHICRNRKCCNPMHLRVVTSAENSLAAPTVATINKQKTHCKRGHEFTSENTYHVNNERHCRVCKRMRNLKNTREHRRLPKVVRLPIEERIAVKLHSEGECLIWCGGRDGGGFPKMRNNKRTILPHRIIYQSVYGDIPENYNIYRTCSNRLCCAAKHLYAMPVGSTKLSKIME